MLKRISVKLIRFYQNYLSKGTCMYFPTCSQYMLEAILKRGFFVGVCLGIFRIIRCVPWVKGCYDPVPDKKSVIKWVY